MANSKTRPETPFRYSPLTIRLGGSFPGLELEAERRQGDAPFARRFLAVEFQRLDAAAALGDLVGGNEHLRYVLRRLAEVLLQLEHALAQAPDVAHQVADLGADLPGRLTHARVFKDLLHHLDGKHQQRG